MTNKITKLHFKKAKMGTYNKYVFVKLFEQLEDKNFYKNENLLLGTPTLIKKLILTIDALQYQYAL